MFDDLRTRIIHCLAQVEALIDFGEGEDLEEGVYDQGVYSVSFTQYVPLTLPSQKPGKRHSYCLPRSGLIWQIIVEVKSSARVLSLQYLALQTQERVAC